MLVWRITHREHNTVPVVIDTRHPVVSPAFQFPKLEGRGDLTLALGEQPIGRESLASGLNAVTMGDKDTRIFLRADQEVAYGALMEVMNLMRKAGYLKVALVGLEKPPPQ